MKKKINHKNDAICFRKIYNKWVALIIGKETLKILSKTD